MVPDQTRGAVGAWSRGVGLDSNSLLPHATKAV
jgi:hypothetical protein